MALDGPIDTKIKTYLKNALRDDLDELLSQYMNAFVLQQRIVHATNHFEKNTNLSAENKILLQKLVTAAQDYLDNFNKKLLLEAIDNALTGLRSGQGMIFNLSQSSKVCSEIAQLLMPIKEDLIHHVNIDSLIDSFILVEKSALITAAALPPPPPPSPASLPKVKAQPLKPIVKAPPPKEAAPIVASEKEFNRELLLKKLKKIEKELSPEVPAKTEGDTPKLNLNIKRELSMVALEAQRRRDIKRLAQVRSDPSSVERVPGAGEHTLTSRGVLFLSMIRSELSSRNQRDLKAKATRQQVATSLAKNEPLPIEDEFAKLKITNKPNG
jgi:hypothetical protein